MGQIYLLGNPLLAEPLRPEHVKPRLLGHWGTTPGLNLIYAHLNRVIKNQDLNVIYICGPGHGGPGDGGEHLPGGHLQRALPGRHPGRRRDGPAVQAVLLPRRHPLARGAGDAGLHPRGRRARLRAGARLRGGVRQPGPDRGLRDRRRRGRDRAAGRQLALEQVPQPGHRRRGAADPAPERVQDRQPDGAGPDTGRRARVAAARLRVPGRTRSRATTRSWSTSSSRPPWTRSIAEIRAIQRRAREDGDLTRPAWPVHRAAHAQGLDRAQGGGRAAGGGDLAGAPGPDRRGRGEPRSTWRSSRSGCAPTAPGELFDASGALVPELAGAGPARRPADEREPARQRRAAAARPAAARLPRVRGGRPRARRDDLGGHPGARRLAARRDRGQPVELPAVRPGRDRIQPARRRLRGDGQAVRGADRAGRQPPGPGRPGDGGAVRAHVPGLAGGLPADRAARPVQLLRGVHPHHRLDVQPARQVAEGHPRHPLAAPGRVAELPALLAGMAAGPQRLLAPGPRLHRPRGEQEGRGHPGLPAAGREHPAVGGGPLPALAALRQRDRGGQAAAVQLAVHGRGDHPLHPRRRDLGVGRRTTRPARPTW